MTDRTITLPKIPVARHHHRRQPRHHWRVDLYVWTALIVCQGGVILALSWLVAQRPNCLPQQRPAVARDVQL